MGRCRKQGQGLRRTACHNFQIFAAEAFLVTTQEIQGVRSLLYRIDPAICAKPGCFDRYRTAASADIVENGPFRQMQLTKSQHPYFFLCHRHRSATAFFKGCQTGTAVFNGYRMRTAVFDGSGAGTSFCCTRISLCCHRISLCHLSNKCGIRNPRRQNLPVILLRFQIEEVESLRRPTGQLIHCDDTGFFFCARQLVSEIDA